MTETEIIKFIEAQAKKLGLKESTVCERAVGNSRLYARLKDGKGCSIKTVARLKAHFAAAPKEAAQ